MAINEEPDGGWELAKLMLALEKNRLEMEHASEKAKILNSAIEANKATSNKATLPPSAGEINA